MSIVTLSPRVNRIKPSISSMAVKKVQELKAQGIDLIGLTMGEPDFDTLPSVAEAAARAIAQSQTKYTNVDGTPELNGRSRASSSAKIAWNMR